MNVYIIILIFSVVVAAFAQILLKKSAEKTYTSPIKEYLNAYVIFGYGLMFLSMFITIMAYSGLEFTNVPVIESLGYIVVMFLSYLFFKEKITFVLEKLKTLADSWRQIVNTTANTQAQQTTSTLNIIG